MSIAYVDTSVSTAIAFDKPGAAAHAQRLSEVTRLISSKQLESELRGAFARENPLFVEIARHSRWQRAAASLPSYSFAASRLYPSRVCGSFRPRMRDATTVRRICAVPPPMVNIRASRAIRSSGRLRE